MKSVAHWMTRRFEELRAFGPYATAALISGGSVGSLLVTFVWLLQHHPRREPRA